MAFPEFPDNLFRNARVDHHREHALEHSALIYIAEDQGFFAGNGLNVTMRDYDISTRSDRWTVKQ